MFTRFAHKFERRRWHYSDSRYQLILTKMNQQSITRRIETRSLAKVPLLLGQEAEQFRLHQFPCFLRIVI